MATSGNESPIPIPVDESRDNWNDEDEIVSSTIYVKKDRIFTAVRQGDTSTLKDILDHNADLVNSTNRNDETPLHTASRSGEVDAIKVLLEKGANIDHVDEDGDTALHDAARWGELKAVKVLTERGANVHITNKEGETPLITAVNRNESSVVRYLINERKMDITQLDQKDRIFAAVIVGDISTLKDTLDHNADLVNSTNRIGATPLHYASQNGAEDVIKVLLEKGANIDHVDNDGETPLHTASLHSKVDAIKVLLEKGANIDHVNNEGETPLITAVNENKGDVVRYLINERKMDITQLDQKDRIFAVVIVGDISTLKDILDHNADLVNSTNENGSTPLHTASWSGKVDVIRVLLEKGANIDHVDIDGDTPLHDAAYCGKLKAVKVLTERGADVHITNKEGETPLIKAVNENEGSVVRYLINERKMDITQLDQPTQLKIARLLEERTDEEEVSSDSAADSGSEDETSRVDANLILAYEAAMKEGSESSNQFKLVTLGAEGAGKTSSVNTLLNLPFKPNQESTVGASVNSCTIDMHLASSKWKKITAAFQVTEIPKQYKREVKAAVYSKPIKPMTHSPVQPVPQEVINEVKEMIASKEEIPQDGHIRIVIFDIGGQEVYYDVHFLFLAIEDVALLVFDCSKGLDDPVISRHRTGRFGEKIATRGMQSNIETIELLLHSVYSRGQTAPPGSISPRVPVVIMLGAHAEGLSDKEKELIIHTICQRFDGKPFLEHLPLLEKEAFHFLANSNPNPQSVEHLRSTVLKAAELVITTKRPISYLKFEGKILERIQKAEVRLSRADAIEIARGSGVEGEQAVDALLRYFTNKGMLLYYPEVKSLKNDIFISPQEVSDLVCAVITTHECRPPTADLQQSYHRYNQYALLEEALLNFILQQFRRSKDKQILLGLLNKFNLATEVPPNTRFSHEMDAPQNSASKVFVVPPLLVYDNKVPYIKQDGDIVVQYYFPDKFLPESAFNQLLVKTIQWCCKHNHMVRCIRRGVGYFGFEDACWQQFQLQLCQSTSSVNCYITIQQSHQPPSDMLPVLLQQRRHLLNHLKSAVVEISKCCMPSAKPPVTCLECPLHEEECFPHVVLDIDKRSVLICQEKLLATPVPERCYILLYQETTQVCLPSALLAQKPKISELLKIVIPKIAAHWITVAYFLELEVPRVEIIRKQYPNDPEESCTEVFVHWLTSDEGISLKTWGGLLKALKDIKKLTAVTEQIENELFQRYCK